MISSVTQLWISSGMVSIEANLYHSLKVRLTPSSVAAIVGYQSIACDMISSVTQL
jgi:hypothetical protein